MAGIGLRGLAEEGWVRGTGMRRNPERGGAFPRMEEVWDWRLVFVKTLRGVVRFLSAGRPRATGRS